MRIQFIKMFFLLGIKLISIIGKQFLYRSFKNTVLSSSSKSILGIQSKIVCLHSRFSTVAEKEMLEEGFQGSDQDAQWSLSFFLDIHCILILTERWPAYIIGWSEGYFKLISKSSNAHGTDPDLEITFQEHRLSRM